MNAEFYQRKIKELSDEKLLDLIRTTNNQRNNEIFGLAKEEADRRNLTFDLTELNESGLEVNEGKIDDLGQLRKWNWGAFMLAPIWTLANKLEWWAILCFVPFVNIIAAFYLGLNGNRLAYKKSKLTSVGDFMILQKAWELWGIRMFWLGLFGGIFALFVGILEV